MTQKNPARSRDAPKLRPEDVTPKAARNKVIQDLAVHPATLFPLAGGVVAGAAMLLIATNPVTLGLTVLGFFGGGAAFLWNYVTNGEERAAENMRQMLAQLQKQEDGQVGELQQQCEQLGFEDGAKAASGFAAAYGKLVEYLTEHHQGGLDRYRHLAADANREAIKKLQIAIGLFEALKTVDSKALTRQQNGWKRQLEGADGSAASDLQRKIDSHEELLTLFREKQERLSNLLTRLLEIEAAAENTYLRLVDLGHLDPTDAPDGDGGAAEALESAVEAAAKFEREMLGADKEANEELDRFSRLGQKQ